MIKGSAVNNDGAQKADFFAPGVEGQVRVIREALAVSGVAPETIGYIETHGTGTPLGDPIEIAALQEAFRDCRVRESCAIGSVKPNIGHLHTAGGIAGLIKTALMLHYKTLVPSLHFESPNPHIDLRKGPFHVNVTVVGVTCAVEPTVPLLPLPVESATVVPDVSFKCRTAT